PQSRSPAQRRYLAIAALWGRLKWTQYTRFGIEEDAMPEAPSDIDYTVDIGRHETMFRANTPKGEEFLGGGELTMSNEEAHTFIQDARAAGLTVKSFF
ncbi:hypothetical protein, partial [Bradyrhizobium valentinum]|uniref:hypothetical protein n=2 Tax=Bradyrhizobium TaxID=374 RepID=UPI000A877BA3